MVGPMTDTIFSGKIFSCMVKYNFEANECFHTRTLRKIFNLILETIRPSQIFILWSSSSSSLLLLLLLLLFAIFPFLPVKTPKTFVPCTKCLAQDLLMCNLNEPTQ